MTDREAFEKFACTNDNWTEMNKFLIQRKSDENNKYTSKNTQHDWEIWQAACKYKDEQIQSLCHIKVTQG